MQSVSFAHEARQAVPEPLQLRPLAHAVAVPAMQAPDPLHAFSVSRLPLHVAVPHAVLKVGYSQAPPASQPVAPQVVPVMQVPVQHSLLAPQTPDVHSSLVVHEPIKLLGMHAPLEQ